MTHPIRRFLSVLTVTSAAVSWLLVGCQPGDGDAALATEAAVLTHAPAVPPAISRSHSTRVVVNIETQELVQRLADGVDYTFWTFGGTVPGQFIRVREGDVVEFHLNNRPDSRMPHNIDLHAVTGPGGGATSSLVSPGQSARRLVGLAAHTWAGIEMRRRAATLAFFSK